MIYGSGVVLVFPESASAEERTCLLGVSFLEIGQTVLRGGHGEFRPLFACLDPYRVHSS
jgi:hypothetical protein